MKKKRRRSRERKTDKVGGAILDDSTDLLDRFRGRNLDDLEDSRKGSVLEEVDDDLPELFFVENFLLLDVLFMERREHRVL